MTRTPYADEAEIDRIGERFSDLSLPRAEWTHPAHFAATLWLLRRRPGMAIEAEMPGMIRRYNESVGGVNSDTAGYHETITLASIRAARAFLAGAGDGLPLHEALAGLLASPCGDKDWPLAHWSRDRLMSVEARRSWMDPDLAPLPF